MLAAGKGESSRTQHPSSHLGLPGRAPGVLNPPECHREGGRGVARPRL